MIVPHHHQNVHYIRRSPFKKSKKENSGQFSHHPTTATAHSLSQDSSPSPGLSHAAFKFQKSGSSQELQKTGLELAWKTPATKNRLVQNPPLAGRAVSRTSHSLCLLGHVTQSCIFVTRRLRSIMLHSVCIINKASSSQPTGSRIRACA